MNISIGFDSKSKISKDLNTLLASVSKDSKIKIDLDTTTIHKSLSELSKSINEVTKNLQNAFNTSIYMQQAQGVNTVTKAYEKQASLVKQANDVMSQKTTFNGKGEVISTVTKLNEAIGQTSTVTQNAKGEVTKLVEEINKVTQTKAEDKLFNIKDSMQSKLNTSSSNELINKSVITDLQNKLNSINTDTPEREIKALQEAIKNLSSSDSNIVRLQNTISKMEGNLEGLKGKYGSLISGSGNANELKAYEKEITNLKNVMTEVKKGTVIDGTKISSEINKGTNAEREFKNAIINSSNALKLSQKDAISLGDSIKRSLANVGIYASSAMIFRQVFQSIKTGVGDIIEIDTAMRDLTKVAKATTDQLKEFPTVANEIGITIGKSTEEIIKATEYYSRLGYAIEEATERATKATVFSNIGDMGIDDATKSLITIQKGFDLNKLEDMTRIMDVANEVGNNYTSSTKDIADGLRQMGNVMKEAGNSYEESVGLFVAGNASIQDADKVGNGIKTITMRLRGMKTEIDETSIPVSKLRDAIKQLTASAGQEVDIMKDDNTFKSTYEQMTELAKVYPKLTDGQRSYLQYVIAGQRQGNILSGMLGNMTEGINAYNTAMNSMGSSAREQEIYMNSIEGKINAFKESVKKLWVDSISSESVKGLVSAGTSLVNMLGTLINTFGATGTALGILSVSLMLFKGQAIMGAIAGISSFIASLQSAIAFSGIFKIAMAELNILMSTNPFGVVAVAITAVVVGLMALDKAVSNSTDNLKKMKDASDDLAKTKSAEALANQYTTLNNTISNSKSTVDEVKTAKEELTEVQRKLADQFPELIDGYDNEGKAIVRNIDAVNKKILSDKDGAIREATEGYKGLFKEMTTFSMGEAISGIGILGVAGALKGQLPIAEYQNLLNKQSEWTDKEKERFAEIHDKLIDMNKTVLSIQNNGGDISGMKMFDFDSKKFIDASTYIADVNAKAKETGNIFNDAGQEVDEFGNIIDKTTGSLKELGGEFDTLSGKVGIIDTIIKEIKDHGEISDNTASTLISKYPDILKLMAQEGDMVGNLKKYQSELRAEKQATLDKAVALAIGDTNATVDSLNNKSTANAQYANKSEEMMANLMNAFGHGYDADGKNWANSLTGKLDSYDQYMQKLSQKVISPSTNPFDRNEAMKQMMKGEEGYLESLKNTDKYAQALQSKWKVQGIGGNGISSGGGSSKITSGNHSSEKSKKDKQEVADLELKTHRYDELESAIDRVNNQLSINETYMKNASDTEKIKYLKQQIDLYNQLRQSQTNLRSEEQKELSETRNKLASSGFNFGASGELTNIESRLQALKNYANSLDGDAKKAEIDRVKGLEDLVSVYQDLINNKIPSANKEIADINNQIIDQQKSIADILKKQVDDHIKAEEKKTDATKKELSKRKEAYQKLHDDTQKEDELAEKQNSINELEDNLTNALRTGDSELIKSIRKQIESAKAEMDKYIYESEYQAGLDRFDEESSKLDEDLQSKIDKINESFSDEELLKMVQQGVTDLSSALNNIDNSTNGVTKTFASITTIIKDGWIKGIDDFASKLRSISSDIINVELKTNTTSVTPNSSVGNITIKQGDITIQGNVANDTLPDLEKMLERNKEETIREISESFRR